MELPLFSSVSSVLSVVDRILCLTTVISANLALSN
jgi:hypothetical protein